MVSEVDVFTIFPDVIDGYCGASILGRAREAGVLEVRVHDLREGADDPRRSVDDSPFGGGAGMVLMAEPLFRSVESVEDLPRPLFLLSPGGRRFDQAVAAELAASGDGERKPRAAAASRCSAGATRGWTSGWQTTWPTGSSRWATTYWREGSWRLWWS